MVRVVRWLVPNGHIGITLYPFILLKSKRHKENKVVINHERIHLAQQKELLVVFFYVLYAFHFLYNYAKSRNWDKAYRNIIFEKEAYSNEKDLEYLKRRKNYAYWRKK